MKFQSVCVLSKLQFHSCTKSQMPLYIIFFPHNVSFPILYIPYNKNAMFSPAFTNICLFFVFSSYHTNRCSSICFLRSFPTLCFLHNFPSLYFLQSFSIYIFCIGFHLCFLHSFLSQIKNTPKCFNTLHIHILEYFSIIIIP